MLGLDPALYSHDMSRLLVVAEETKVSEQNDLRIGREHVHKALHLL